MRRQSARGRSGPPRGPHPVAPAPGLWPRPRSRGPTLFEPHGNLARISSIGPRDARKAGVDRRDGGHPDMADAIVVTYRSAGSIGACLDALLDGDLHVVVVDNAGTADVVRERFPQVELIANDENVGFPRAVNQGLLRCEGDGGLL